MRKKYLSALLFGALLFASAGTFTSCKDYDDDIKNLQEQINTIASSLDDLKAQVGDKGVTSVTVEGGKLIVVTDGQSVSYDLPAGAEMEEIEIKDGHLYVGGVDKGAVGGSNVTVNEDGVLLIDGEDAGLKVGTEVVIKDSTNGIYTITIGDQTIQLPMASANITVETTAPSIFTGINITTENGFCWGEAGSDIEWNGPLGNIAKGSLLVGQISTVGVEVLPATFDLSSADLKLIDTEGNYAEVTVAAEPKVTKGPNTSGSRAVSKTGEWILSVKPTAEVTPDNVETIYTYNKKNVTYALEANGTIVSGYDFIIDSRQEKEQPATAVTAKAGEVYYGNEQINSAKLPVGDCELSYHNGNCVDAYLTFEGTNVELAKELGVEVDGMTVKVSDTLSKYTGSKSLQATVYVLDTTGKITKANINLTGEKTTVEDAVVASATDYKVAYKANSSTLNDLVIDFGTLISSNMTNSEIEAIKNANQFKFEIKDNKADKFITAITSLKAGSNLYLDDKMEKQYNVAQNSLAEVKKLKLPISTVQSNAEAGTYTLVMTLFDADASNANEIKKFEFPINITLPTFDELFTKSGSWTGDVVTLKLSNATTPSVDFTGTLSSTSVQIASNLAKFSVSFDNINNNDINGSNGINLSSTGNFEIKKKDNILKDGAYLPIQGVVSYNFGGKLAVESNKITVNFKSLLDGATLQNYANGAAAGLTINAASGTFSKFVAGSGNTKDAGLALVLNDKKYAITGIINGVTLSETDIDVKFDAKAGSSATTSQSYGDITYSGVNNGNYTTNMTITITEDNTGIVTTMTIPVSVNF